MPVTSRAKKQRVVIQCVTRTKAECLGASFGIGAVETRLGMDASAGSCAGPKVATVYPPTSHVNTTTHYVVRQWQTVWPLGEYSRGVISSGRNSRRYVPPFERRPPRRPPQIAMPSAGCLCGVSPGARPSAASDSSGAMRLSLAGTELDLRVRPV